MVLLLLGCVPASETGKVDPVETGDSDSACVAAPWYPDLDGDGYGDEAGVVDACAPPEGWTEHGGDCDDANETVNPAAVDPCGDGIDWDCDGADPECPWAGVVDLGTMTKLTGTEPGEDAGRLFDVADVTDDGVPDLFVATFGADAYGGGGYLVPGPITASGSLGELGFAFSGDAATTYGAGRAIGLGDVDGRGPRLLGGGRRELRPDRRGRGAPWGGHHPVRGVLRVFRRRGRRRGGRADGGGDRGVDGRVRGRRGVRRPPVDGGMPPGPAQGFSTAPMSGSERVWFQ